MRYLLLLLLLCECSLVQAATVPVQPSNTIMGCAGTACAPGPLTVLPNGLSTPTPGTLSGNFYLSDGAKLWNLTDRVMIGTAALGNGNLAFSGLPTWVGPNYLFRDGQLGAISSYGLWGMAAASRTSDYTGVLQQSTGALGVFTMNDGGRGSARTVYAEINHTNTSPTSGSSAFEIDIKDTGGVSNTITPYGGSAHGTSGAAYFCGGDSSYGIVANTNCNFVMSINLSAGLTTTWNKGIVFASGSLTGATGVNGGGNAAQAIEMGYGQGIRWFSSNGLVPAGRISSIGTSSADQSHDMQFVNNGVQFVNNSATNTFAMTHVASGQNGVLVTDAVNAAGPIIAPVSGDSETNLPLNLRGLGTGAVAVGSLLSAPQYSQSGSIASAFGTTGVGISVAGQTQTDSTTGAGTITSVYFHNLGVPTFATAANAITITNAYTLDIAGCPIAGTNVTITTCGGLRVVGQAQFNGLVNAGAGLTAAGAAVTLNGTGSSTTSIGTGGNTGAITIGGGSNTLTMGDPVLETRGAISTGTKFTTTGCSVSATAGGATAGSFTLGANTCTVVVTMAGATGITSPNGWSCQAHDKTAPTVLIGGESTSNPTTASITIPAGAGTTDVISFSCTGY